MLTSIYNNSPVFGKNTLKRYLIELYLYVMVHVMMIVACALAASNSNMAIGFLVFHCIFTLLYCIYFSIMIYSLVKTGNPELNVSEPIERQIWALISVSSVTQLGFTIFLLLNSENLVFYVLAQIIVGVSWIIAGILMIVGCILYSFYVCFTQCIEFKDQVDEIAHDSNLIVKLV